MQLDLTNLQSFFTHCQNVTQAAENLPLIISAPTFKEANDFAREEIKKLHDSLFIITDGEYLDAQGVRRNCFTCTPLAPDIAKFLNDDGVENNEVEKATYKTIQSFLDLLTSLNKFIRLKNELPPNGYNTEKNVIEESFTELTNVLGTIIKLLDDDIKDLFENCIYEGPALGSIRRQMDKVFHGQTKTTRELLALDKNKDGSIRKKPVDKKALEDKAKSKAQQDRKTQRSRAKLDRKRNQRK